MTKIVTTDINGTVRIKGFDNSDEKYQNYVLENNSTISKDEWAAFSSYDYDRKIIDCIISSAQEININTGPFKGETSEKGVKKLARSAYCDVRLTRDKNDFILDVMPTNNWTEILSLDPIEFSDQVNVSIETFAEKLSQYNKATVIQIASDLIQGGFVCTTKNDPEGELEFSQQMMSKIPEIIANNKAALDSATNVPISYFPKVV